MPPKREKKPQTTKQQPGKKDEPGIDVDDALIDDQCPKDSIQGDKQDSGNRSGRG